MSIHLMYACDFCGATNASPRIDRMWASGDPEMMLPIVQALTERSPAGFACPACALEHQGKEVAQQDWDNFRMANERACVRMREREEVAGGTYQPTVN